MFSLNYKLVNKRMTWQKAQNTVVFQSNQLFIWSDHDFSYTHFYLGLKYTLQSGTQSASYNKTGLAEKVKRKMLQNNNSQSVILFTHCNNSWLYIRSHNRSFSIPFPPFLLIYLYIKGQCTLVNISLNVPVLASWLIFNCSTLARCFKNQWGDG